MHYKFKLSLFFFELWSVENLDIHLAHEQMHMSLILIKIDAFPHLKSSRVAVSHRQFTSYDQIRKNIPTLLDSKTTRGALKLFLDLNGSNSVTVSFHKFLASIVHRF